MTRAWYLVIVAVLLAAGCETGTPPGFDSGPGMTGNDAGPGEADCFDGRQNGDETDRDCGGSCPQCTLGRRCEEGTDCRSGACIEALCAEPSCNDGVQNQDESDIDCGGSCDLCADGLRCQDDDDCGSASCRGGVCAEATCDDGVMNDRETDVDCGGPICDGCAEGQMCGRRDDCVDFICLDGACAPPSCTDNITNGDETDRDCGGTVCRGCRDRQMCVVPGDCNSNDCVGGQCNGNGEFSDDFESGTFIREWSTFAPAWTITMMNPITGTYSAQSGNIPDNSSSVLELRVTCPAAGTVTFDYDVSASSGDALEFSIDSSVPTGGRLNGTRSGMGSFPLTMGMHTLRWRYTKDFFSTSGRDNAIIDNVMTAGCSGV